ncbi:IclR family transcriptional regulator [Williamsia limnetica]|uniref:IclR family transcriptional regulator n=1 Tax=Williamsia limnetica TaxID=882452 RepID=A0A318RC68_WILLI|nr:helix-turn-helix domain-containing protein [Williamsia limnetica]PYE12203.1 IclR family transcriptional regulator [Williamsia limnetica]
MSARRSPQTERLVDVIELLSAPPGRSESLTDLAAALDIDKTTLYPMLTELTRVGWVVKHPSAKTYQLGPALARIGGAAEAGIAELAPTADALSSLAESTGKQCCVVVPSGGDLVVAKVQSAIADDTGGLQLRPGDRVGFSPPLGAVLVAWSSAASVDAWLERNPQLAEHHSRYRDILVAVRRRHYAVEQYPSAVAGFNDMAASATGPNSYGSRRTSRFTEGQQSRLGADILVGAIDDHARYRPLSVNAPIFGAGGRPVGALCALDASAPITGSQLVELGELVSSVADDVTSRLGGRAPYRRAGG